MAMDLRDQLESLETTWSRERKELLDRFDSEREEWESQWKVMQKKIEELYQEVKIRRENHMNEQKGIKGNRVLQISLPPSDSGIRASTEPKPKLGQASDGRKEGFPLQEGTPLTRKKQQDGFMDKPGDKGRRDCVAWAALKTSEMDPQSSTGALNIALEELARVSEDLCSFQEEIRKKSSHSWMMPTPRPAAGTATRPQGNPEASVDPQTSLICPNAENWKQSVEPAYAYLPCATPHQVEGGLGTLPGQEHHPPPAPPPRSTSRNLVGIHSEGLRTAGGPKRNAGGGNYSETQEAWSGQKGHNRFLATQQESCLNKGDIWKDATHPLPLPVAKIAGHAECSDGVGASLGPHGVHRFGEDVNSGLPSPRSCQESCSDAKLSSSEQVILGPHTPSSWGRRFGDSLSPPGPLGDAVGSDCHFEKPSRNEKLAEKTDEFNRTVFRTDKCSSSGRQAQRFMKSPGDATPGGTSEVWTVDREEADPGCGSSSLGPVENGPHQPLKSPPPSGAAERGQERPGVGGPRPRPPGSDWRPSDLCDRPRSADPRSNYGVVEKLLKSYESSVGAAWCQAPGCPEKWARPDPGSPWGIVGARSQVLERPQRQPGRGEDLRKDPVKHAGLLAKQGLDRKKPPEDSGAVKSTSGKGFSRPARPANRRLPSRWASRSFSVPPVSARSTISYSASLKPEASQD
uniref:SOGA 1/2-like coiled-coil domain-containing protein n=1 Tax=Ornithorhynchus anatinus TaxID=9258 RepID=F6U1K5_ORNAN